MKAFRPIKKSQLHESFKKKTLKHSLNKQDVLLVADMSTSLSTSASEDVMSYMGMIYGGTERSLSRAIQVKSVAPAKAVEGPDGLEDIDEFD